MNKKFYPPPKKQNQKGINQKVSFPWIAIQNLVENDPNTYQKHYLIESVVMDEETGDKMVVDQPNELLYRFVTFFTYEKLFPQFMTEYSLEKSKKNNSKKNKNKINVKNLCEEREILFQDADLKLFELDNYKFKKIHFQYPICNYLYLCYWCIEILKGLKERKKIHNLCILDAILSMNRMMDKSILTNHYYLQGFELVRGKMNSIVTSKFYDLLFLNPKYLITSSFQNFDTEIKLYKEQKQMIHDIQCKMEQNQPILFANQHPTGQGKTFSCAPLTKLISKKYTNKCVLFACSNTLVRNQMAADILIGHDLHLWLAKHCIIVDKANKKIKKFLIRPFKSCFPSNWKQKYKDDDEKKIGDLSHQWNYYVKATNRIPNIIVADLECCLELLKMPMNSIEESPFVAFIDEFITNQQDGQVMAKICQLLPKQSILLSSVFPKFENIPSIVSTFCSRYRTSMELSCKRVSSSNINIPVAIIDPEGNVKFPHHYIHQPSELECLIQYITKDPRIRRSYPSSYVYHWSKSLESILPQEIWFSNHFDNIGQLNQNDSCEYVILLLTFLLTNFHHLSLFQQYTPKKMDKIDENLIFTHETHKFDVEGKTLCIFNHPTNEIYQKTELLFEGKTKLETLIKEVENKKKLIQKKISTLQKMKGDNEMFDKKNNIEEISEMQTELANLKVVIPSNMMLNHTDHYKRFHPTETIIPKSIKAKNQIYLSPEYFDHFSEINIYQLLSGIGVYDSLSQSKYQKELIMKLYDTYLFFCSGKEIIYGTNLSNLCNIYLPWSVCESLSIPEMYQLIGRVGRPGSSNHANIVTTDDRTVQTLLSLDDSYERTEIDVENEVRQLVV